MRRAAPLLAGLASLALLAACSTGEPVDIDGSGTDQAPGGEGQMLHVAIGGEPDQLDPNKTSSYFSFEVLENVYDTLVETDENLEMQPALDRKSTRLNSSHVAISYAVFCLKKKTPHNLHFFMLL